MRALSISLVAILCGCGAGPGPGPSMNGDCGPVLSAAECQIIRTQLGTLDPQPPADPTNRWGRWTGASTNEKDDEDRAAALGQRLFFDRCLSEARDTSCETCHDRAVALIDPRASELQVEVTTPEGRTYLPPIVNPTADRARRPPPEVEPQRDLNGDPLAFWDAKEGRWRGVVRRHQASRSSSGAAYTARNSPTVYNLAYGGGVSHDGARTAGATWVPWDGRYDSAWALVADVYEFGATHRTNRAHLAYRIFKKHRAQYEAMIGAKLPDMDMMDVSQPALRRYPRNASPNTGFNAAWVGCWKGTGPCDPDGQGKPATAPLSAAVRDEINTIFVHAGKALSAYMRRLRSGDSAYDRWLRNDHGTAQTCDGTQTCPMGESCDRRIGRCVMSVAAQRGLRLFIGKAECVMCHGGPNFTDWRFHNLGVPEHDTERRTAGSAVSAGKDGPFAPATQACNLPGAAPAAACPDQGRYAWQNRLAGACEPIVDGGVLKDRACQRSDGQSCATPYSDGAMACLPKALFDPCNYPDAQSCKQAPGCQFIEGMNASGLRQCVPRPTAAELGAFKTPSLRNVARTWPYMHNGALYDYGPAERGETSTEDPTPHLLRVVSFYNEGGGRPTVGERDPLIRPLHLSAGEMSDLVEFLKALSDESASAGPLLTAPSDLADVSKCPE
jgi:cytochrome c peroxidase